MAIPTDIDDLSTTPASNSPDGSEAPSVLDDHIRSAYAIIKQNASKGSDIASSGTITIPAAGSYFDITGTTTITAISDTNTWDGRQVTLQFDSALTIEHSASLIVPGAVDYSVNTGDCIEVTRQSSGVWRLSSTKPRAIVTVITGDTTHTPNANTKIIQFICTGGGGGGGGFKCAGAGTSGSSGGGAGGGTSIKTTSTINTSYTVVVGAGGAGGNNAPSNGSLGEASTVVDDDGGADMNLSGGGGGIGYASTASSGSSYASGVSGGAATGGDINIRGGGTGTRGTINGVAIGNSLGGSSFLGGGANAVINNNGVDCTSYGGGGGGITSAASTTTGYAGGDGGDGVVIVTEYL